MESIKRELVYQGGEGYSINTRESGRFEVRHETGRTRFLYLSDAAEFYNKLDCEKEIWDTTEVSILLEKHTWNL